MLVMILGYVTLGSPYERIIKKIIEKGYAGNQTEVIRQALINYERDIDEKELGLVGKAIEQEMAEVQNGNAKTYPAEDVFAEQRKKRGL